MNRSLVFWAAVMTSACTQASEQPAPDNSTAVGMAKSAPVQAVSQHKLSASRSSLTANVSDLRIRVTDTTTVVDIPSDVLFAFGSAALQPDATLQLSKVVPLIGRGKPGLIEVIGHTDAIGEEAANEVLSKDRAQAVVSFLKQQQAITGSSFNAQGVGELEPIAPNTSADGQDNPAGRARNRRVEIIIPR
jgi:outer membrane protein OmpA-like peptidoglycan-associated protein